MKNFDLIVVGASFAGLACARTAALRGLKVEVLDRESDPGAAMTLRDRPFLGQAATSKPGPPT